MNPPGPTTLWKMQLAALNAADAIEHGQAVRIKAGLITDPDPDQVWRRDAMIGIARLIEKVLNNETLLRALPLTPDGTIDWTEAETER